MLYFFQQVEARCRSYLGGKMELSTSIVCWLLISLASSCGSLGLGDAEQGGS